MNKRPLRVAIIGTAKRSDYLYGPLLRALPDEVELVSVWGRSAESARRLGQSLEAPAYTDLDTLIRETAPEIGIVSVNYHGNGEVGLMAVQAGLHVLLETPIAHRLSEADAIIIAAQEGGLKIEIAEQFHRRPLEQIKLKLIASGLFGRVHTAFNDFAGHGYHGVSVLRSYLGFDAKPLQVTGAVRQYDLTPHWARLAETRGPRTETQEHGLIEFEGGQIGIFHGQMWVTTPQCAGGAAVASWLRKAWASPLAWAWMWRNVSRSSAREVKRRAFSRSSAVGNASTVVPWWQW